MNKLNYELIKMTSYNNYIILVFQKIEVREPLGCPL